MHQASEQRSTGTDHGVEAASSPPAGGKARIYPYDFRQPRLFAQDQMRMLSYVHETFVRDFAVFLSTQLRTIVDIRVASVEQMPYAEYVLSSASPSALYVVATHDMGYRLVFAFDPRLVVFIVEKLFGSAGMSLGETREISRIEQGIMMKVMNRALRELERAWKQLYEVHLRTVAFESNAEFIQIMPGTASAFVLTFEVSVYEQQSVITVCYPYLLLERMLSRSGAPQWSSTVTSDVPPAVRERYEDALRSVTVEVSAELGRARLPLQALMELEVGDVIPLQRRVNEPVGVYVDRQEKFKAAAGKAGKHRALRILDVIEPQQQDDESL